MSKVFVIAEAGVNHNGSLRIAKKLVDVASYSGADAIKFQTFTADNIVIRGLPKAKYQILNSRTNESQFEMLKKLELSRADYKQLFQYCRRKNILVISSPFDVESVDFLDRLGMKIFKIASGEITNKPLIQYIATKKKPIILSTGMSYLDEVKRAITWINDVAAGTRLTLLHCISDYPTRIKDINLLSIKTLESNFGLPVGLSDHTVGIEIPIAAVAMGAKVIEKHFTLNKNMQGPDHKISLTPNKLKMMVRLIRNIEIAIGNGIKRPTKTEEATKMIVRRSLVAARDIKAGQTIKMRDVSIKRPGIGIQPENLNKIINKKAAVNISKDTIFKKSDLR